MKLNTTNLITAVLAISILCLSLVAYTIIGSPGITIGASEKPVASSHSERTEDSVASNDYGTETVLLADRSGHYWLDAVVDRTNIRFLIDTGASVTVLSNEDARRVGVDVGRIKYDAPVMTGAGEVKFGRTRLPYVEAGHLRVDGLEALVAGEDALPQSVLGMNFLKRLNGYSVTSNKMTLVP